MERAELGCPEVEVPPEESESSQSIHTIGKVSSRGMNDRFSAGTEAYKDTERLLQEAGVKGAGQRPRSFSEESVGGRSQSDSSVEIDS